MSVRIVAIGPRGHKTYEIRWKNGELYDYHDTRAGAVRKAAQARREEKEYYRPQKNPSKLQRALMAQKKRTERRVADALAKYLKVQNPGQKVTSAKIERLKGGVIKITPLDKKNPSVTVPKWTVLTKDNYWKGEIYARNKTAARREAMRRFGKQSFQIYLSTDQGGYGYSAPPRRR